MCINSARVVFGCMVSGRATVAFCVVNRAQNVSEVYIMLNYPNSMAFRYAYELLDKWVKK
jgi:hypothetical protein